MGLYMDTGSVKNQLREMNSNLRETILNAQILLGKIENFIDTPLLQAESYGNLKEYYGSFHIPVIRGLICCAENLEAENEIYSSLIDLYFSDVGYVDEDGLEEDAERIRRTLDIIEEAPQMTSGLFGLKRSMENQKRDIEEKLEKINQFVINAQGVYSGNQNMEALIRQGIGVMQGISYCSSQRRFQIEGLSLEWQNELNKSWGRRNELAGTESELINRIKEQCPQLSEEEIGRILEYMVENPVKENQTLEEYLTIHKTEIDRLGLGTGAISQAFSITYSILGEINKEQGKWLLENAEKTFGYSAKTADDLIKCADDIDQAIRVGEKGAKFAHFSKYNMTVIGSVLDYGVLRAGGAGVGEAVVKTTVHAATGYVVGTAVTAIVMSPTAIPVGIVVGAGIAVTMVLNSYFDSEYDNIGFLKDIDGFIDKTIDGVGKGLKDFFSGVVEIFE